MATIRHVDIKDGDVLVMLGTVKGAFLARSGRGRSRWELAGPYFPGQPVYAVAYDGRQGRRRLWAATNSFHWGAALQRSDDFGRSWSAPDAVRLRFPEETGATLKQIWQVKPGRAEEPDQLYCGVEPASLFESRDGGESWSLVKGLYDHPHRPRWEPGGGGLCLHTILPDPADRDRLLVAISTGGVYRTDDGGRSWRPRNQGIRAEFLPDKHPEFGQCVHKLVGHPSRPERLFLQNHWGLYRSDDAGDSWQDVANGVPSDFGFAMEMHPHDADTLYIVPLESDEFRCPPKGRLRVYRTRNAGRSWEPLAKGLPQAGFYETVLRDSLAADSLDPAGLYFGTRGGKLFASADEGASWQRIFDGLPAVLCVKAVVVGKPRAGKRRRARPAQGRRSRPSGTRPARRPRGRKSQRRAARAARVGRRPGSRR